MSRDATTPSPQAGMTVRVLEEGDEQRWDSFVYGHASATFFHLAGWRDIFENVLHVPTTYLYCEVGGDITGVLPLAHMRSRLFGNSLISLPFLVYGGIVASGEDAQQCLAAAACEKAANLDVDYLELRNVTPSGRDWPVKSQYVTFVKTLDPDPEVNLNAIPRKQRAMIRKAMKFDLQADRDADAGRLYDALLPCKRNLGTPFFGRRYLQSIMDRFGDDVEVTTVTRGTELVSSVMSFRFRDQILPYYGGGGDIARHVNGNDFMYWAVMKKACEDGVKVFDYGRSTEGTGAYRFKKHWGFEPSPLAYEYKLVNSESVPNLSPTNKKYQLAIRLWKKLPLPLAGLIGPHLARRLG